MISEFENLFPNKGNFAPKLEESASLTVLIILKTMEFRGLDLSSTQSNLPYKIQICFS